MGGESEFLRLLTRTPAQPFPLGVRRFLELGMGRELAGGSVLVAAGAGCRSGGSG